MTPGFLSYANGFLLPHEGVTYENGAADSGNKGDGKTPGNVGTKFGVDAASHPGVDIVNLTQAGALAIYWGDWTRCFMEQLPYAIAIACFDEEENEGIHWGSVNLQIALNMQPGLALNGDTILTDGKIGPQTIAAANAAKNVLAITDAMLTLRTQRYLKIVAANPNDKGFLPGWLDRVQDMRSWVLRVNPSTQVLS